MATNNTGLAENRAEPEASKWALAVSKPKVIENNPRRAENT